MNPRHGRRTARRHAQNALRAPLGPRDVANQKRNGDQLHPVALGFVQLFGRFRHLLLRKVLAEMVLSQ